MTTYVIADIGSCHDGDLALLLKAPAAAKAAGCDAIKYQWVSDPEAMAARRGAALADGYAPIYRRFLNWPKEWHENIAARCAEVGIDYMCTTYLAEDIAVVAPHVARFKVASFEAMDLGFIAAHVGYAKPLIVSTGMLDLSEVYTLIDCRNWPGAYQAERRGLINEFMKMRIDLLHCVSAYPTPGCWLNLAVLRLRFSGDGSTDDFVFDGFSDHSDPSDTWTGALAVAAGASIVEAHLRLFDTDPENPDFAHAMTPTQFKEYVEHIRYAEVRVGTSSGRALQDCEQAMARYRVRP